MIKLRETFRFSAPIQIKGESMIGLTSLEVYNFIFNITEKNNKFELYTGPLFTEFSCNALKDKVAEVLGLSDISIEDSEDEIHGRDVKNLLKRARLMVNIFFQTVINKHHFEILNFI